MDLDNFMQVLDDQQHGQDDDMDTEEEEKS